MLDNNKEEKEGRTQPERGSAQGARILLVLEKKTHKPLVVGSNPSAASFLFSITNVLTLN